MNALWGLLRKETYHILRDRRTLAVLIFMPVVQVVLFGFSIRTDVKNVRLAIVDPSPDATTLAIRARFTATDMFRVIAVVSNAADLDPLLRPTLRRSRSSSNLDSDNVSRQATSRRS